MALDQVELAARFAEEDRVALETAVTDLMKSPAGRKYLWHLLTLGKLGIQPFNSDPLLTAFQCGELNVGQQILAHMLEVNPGAYGVLQKEQVYENDRRTKQLAGAATRPSERDDPDFN